MRIRHSALALLLAASFASPVQAQSYDEAESANSSALEQRRLLDRAEGSLLSWLAENAEEADLDARQVDGIADLLKGWRTYTSMECNLVGITTGGNPASKATYTSMCEERRYIDRIRTVSAAKNCLMQVLRKSQKATLYASDCLPPLTPLKTDSDYEG